MILSITNNDSSQKYGFCLDNGIDFIVVSII